ncbi:hypothetical protein NP233_g6360 [Leucocoprinus birnbaumii]|uniref:Uncharacterized protein n=1 Tax=Leucocoprinus birnbaumii TaxID=56174 RepID=A0AAD5VTF8_9AGAR|nr:hypothetical protein NP233_g6360 [Leucocoprinus birnbaumii]
MDRFYDRESARSTLHNVIMQAIAEESDVPVATLPWAHVCVFRPLLRIPSLNLTQDVDATLTLTRDPAMWRLISPQDEELVVRVFGIVSVRAIPPFLRRFNERNPPREYLKQSIVITGLGDDMFLDQIQALTRLTDRFANDPAFQSRLCIPYNGSVFEDHPAMCAGTRIFTQRSSAPGALEVLFEPGVDETGTLMAFKPDHLVHCADNVVEYREKGNANGVRLAKPSAFAVGDIVELHVCIRWVSTSDHQAKSIVNLIRLTKVSDVFRREARRGRETLVRSLIVQPDAPRSFKRARLPPLLPDDVDCLRQDFDGMRIPPPKKMRVDE